MRCNVLIVMKNKETVDQMSGILAARGCNVTDTCTGGMQGLRSAGTRPCDIALVGFSLPDMTGLAFAEALAGISTASVLLVVPPEQMSFVRHNAGQLDVTCLPRPVTPQALATSIDMLLQFRERYQRMQEEARKLKSGLEQRNLAEKAKQALMKSMGLTESEAWRHIQKQSMDTGKPLGQVARHILDIYGTHAHDDSGND